MGGGCEWMGTVYLTDIKNMKVQLKKKKIKKKEKKSSYVQPTLTKTLMFATIKSR